MINRTLCRLTTAIVAGAIPLFMQSPGIAQVTPTVRIAPTAQLAARLLIIVPVTYACPKAPEGEPEFFGRIGVQVRQAFGKDRSFGSGGTPAKLVCDNKFHTVNVTVVSGPEPTPFQSSSSGVFHGGKAVADAFLEVCSDLGCMEPLATDGPEVIMLKGKPIPDAAIRF